MPGAVTVIIGLYLALWGKSKDEGQVKDQEHNKPKISMESSAERPGPLEEGTPRI